MSSSEQEDATRYVLADCVETGQVRCFARVPPRAERVKDPFKRRSYRVYWYPQHSLRGIYSGQRDHSGVAASPFWSNARLVKRSDIPEGVTIP